MDKQILRVQKAIEKQEKKLVKQKEFKKVIELEHQTSLENQRVKWEEQNIEIERNIGKIQTRYQENQTAYQEELNQVKDDTVQIKDQQSCDEIEEKAFLKQLEAELSSVINMIAGKTCRSQDGLEDSLSPRDQPQTNILLELGGAKEAISQLLGKYNTHFVPPLSDLGIALDKVDANPDGMMFTRVLYNDDTLDGLTMSEREAVVYQIINNGTVNSNNEHDVKLEDILQILPEDDKKSILLSSRVTKLEDLSSFLDDNKSQKSVDLSYTVPEVIEDLDTLEKSMNQVKRLEFSPLSTLRTDNIHNSRSYVYSDRISDLSESGDHMDQSFSQDESQQGLVESFRISRLKEIREEVPL